jgi:hypothetical protein
MKESYQREEYCNDQRKGSLPHFQPPKNIAMNNRNCLGDPEATAIHIMLMLHPPGMGMAIDIVWLNQAVMAAADRKRRRTQSRRLVRPIFPLLALAPE